MKEKNTKQTNKQSIYRMYQKQSSTTKEIIILVVIIATVSLVLNCLLLFSLLVRYSLFIIHFICKHKFLSFFWCVRKYVYEMGDSQKMLSQLMSAIFFLPDQ